MASISVAKAAGAGTGDLLIACVEEHGSAAHPYFSSAALVTGPDSARNLADAVHFLCAMHGRHPGVVDHAAGRAMEAPARAWLIEASEAMATERLYLTQLAVAAGPIPSTPGGGGSEAAVIGQRNALCRFAMFSMALPAGSVSRFLTAVSARRSSCAPSLTSPARAG
jgi:hypothetical protein